MKVKNLVFFGVAAAILSTAGANAADVTNYGAVRADTDDKNIVTSKYYVDTSTDALRNDIAAIDIPDVSGFQTKLGGENHGGQLVTSTTTEGTVNYTTVASSINTSSSADDTNIPTVGAVETLVSGVAADIPDVTGFQNKLGGAGHDGQLVTSTTTEGTVNYTGVATSIDTSVNTDDSNIPTVGAVEGLVSTATSGMITDVSDKQDNLGGAGNGGKLVTSTTTAGTVTYTDVASSINTSSSADDTNIPTVGAVETLVSGVAADIPDVTGFQNKLGGAGHDGQLVTSTTTEGTVNYTTVASSINTSSSADDTNIPTVGAVEGAISTAVSGATNGNVIPARTGDCAPDAANPKNCALVADAGGNLVWRVMAGN